MRKTVRIEDVVKKVNRMIAATGGPASAPARDALCCLVENILFEAGAYCGFSYLDITDADYHRLANGAPFNSLGIDSTRRAYAYHKATTLRAI